MSYDNHPGGGYQEVPGYQPPGGSMADEQRRQREAAEQAARQAEADRFWREQQAEQARAEQARAAQQQQAAKQKQQKQQQKQKAGKAGGGRPARPATSGAQDWNGFFATIAFLAAGYWGIKLGKSPEPNWVAGGIAGVVAGYLAGRFYKVIVTVGVVAGGIWAWSHFKDPENAARKSRRDASRTVGTRAADRTPPRSRSGPAPARVASAAPSSSRSPRASRSTAPSRSSSRAPSTSTFTSTSAARRAARSRAGLTPTPSRSTSTRPAGRPTSSVARSAGSRPRRFFASQRDFDVVAWKDVQPDNRLWIYHARAIDYASLARFEYATDRNQVIVVKKDGSRLPLGGDTVPADLRREWTNLSTVHLGRTRNKELLAKASFPIVRTRARARSTTTARARRFIGAHFSDRASNGRGVHVDYLMCDLPAQRAGLQRGDRVDGVAGRTVRTAKDVIDAVRSSTAARVRLSVWRGTKRLTIDVKPVNGFRRKPIPRRYADVEQAPPGYFVGARAWPSWRNGRYYVPLAPYTTARLFARIDDVALLGKDLGDGKISKQGKVAFDPMPRALQRAAREPGVLVIAYREWPPALGKVKRWIYNDLDRSLVGVDDRGRGYDLGARAQAMIRFVIMKCTKVRLMQFDRRGRVFGDRVLPLRIEPFRPY